MDKIAMLTAALIAAGHAIWEFTSNMEDPESYRPAAYAVIEGALKALKVAGIEATYEEADAVLRRLDTDQDTITLGVLYDCEGRDGADWPYEDEESEEG